jgi:hypothetical protein
MTDARDPDVARGATRLTDVLAAAEAQGFDHEFETVGGWRDADTAADDGAALRCPACDTTSAAGRFTREWSRRLEGASDPADMLHVSAIVCPACGAGGVFISPFGPSASAEQAAVLRALPKH